MPQIAAVLNSSAVTVRMATPAAAATVSSTWASCSGVAPRASPPMGSLSSSNGMRSRARSLAPFSLFSSAPLSPLRMCCQPRGEDFSLTPSSGLNYPTGQPAGARSMFCVFNSKISAITKWVQVSRASLLPQPETVD